MKNAALIAALELPCKPAPRPVVGDSRSWVSRRLLNPISAVSATAGATRALNHPPCRTRARARWFGGDHGLLIVGNLKL
jgi:hypothetical protein